MYDIKVTLTLHLVECAQQKWRKFVVGHFFQLLHSQWLKVFVTMEKYFNFPVHSECSSLWEIENFPFWPRSYIIHTLIRLPKLIDSLDKYVTEPRNLIGNWKELSAIGN